MNTNKLRMPLDITMTLLSVILMGGTMLFPNDRVHQFLGMALLALWAFHITLNYRWYGAIPKGKYNDRRIMQTVVNCGILIFAVLLMISGLMMAWFVPSEIIGGGLGFARTAHLLSSQWYYLFMAFHLGLHASMIASKMKIHGIVPRVICILISLYGVYAFIVRGLWKYILGLQQFFFFDFERGYILFAVDYISILVLFATISHYAEKIINRRTETHSSI